MSKWNCPHCNGSIGPVPNLAGKVVACPYCCGPVTVPSPTNSAHAPRPRLRWGLLLLIFGLCATAAVAMTQMEYDDIVQHVRDAQVRLASYSAELSEPRVLRDTSCTGCTLTTLAGTGMTCETLAKGINQVLPTTFHDTTPPGLESRCMIAELNNADIILSSDADQLSKVTVVGHFAGGEMATALARVIGMLMPSWTTAEAGDWFTENIDACDANTPIDTTHDDVKLTLVAGDVDGVYWVFFQPEASS